MMKKNGMRTTFQNSFRGVGRPPMNRRREESMWKGGVPTKELKEQGIRFVRKQRKKRKTNTVEQQHDIVNEVVHLSFGLIIKS
ncbi:hypothetical protein V2J09_018029 [Rumex salicifolius]